MDKVFLVSVSFGNDIGLIQGIVAERRVRARYIDRRDLVGVLLNPLDLAAYNRLALNEVVIRLGGANGPPLSFWPAFDLKSPEVTIKASASVALGTAIFLEVHDRFDAACKEFEKARPPVCPPSPEGDRRPEATHEPPEGEPRGRMRKLPKAKDGFICDCWGTGEPERPRTIWQRVKNWFRSLWDKPYRRITIPACYYAPVASKQAPEPSEEQKRQTDYAKKLAADIQFDSFRSVEDFKKEKP